MRPPQYEIQSATLINDSCRAKTSRSSLDHLNNELERMKNENLLQPQNDNDSDTRFSDLRQRSVTWKDTSSTIDLASPTAVRSLEEWFSGRWKRVLLLRFSEATRRKVSRGQSSQSEPCCSWEFVYPVRLRCQGQHFIHSVLCLAKDQDLAFSGKLTKLGCAPLGVAAGCVRVILSAVGCFVLIMVQKGSAVSAGSALNHSVAKLSSSCSGCNDLSSLRCKVDISAFMPYPRDVWIMKRSFWSGCEVVVLSYEWGWVSRRQRAGRFHEDRVVKVNLVVGPHFIHSVLYLAKDQDLAFSGKLTKLGCVPLGVAAGGCVRVILSAVGWFVFIMVQKGSVVSAGSALNHSVAKLSSSCSGCNDLSSLRCKVDISAFMPYPRDVWIMKRSFWSGCEVVVLSYEWGWYRLAGHRQQR
ncbi:hypothetical protein DY000_02055318 [Brassica cretica]|uniref:Uncharacterized protein n=1 Tax=Brassica cretica TaxID=69181 RepID=A0ABQ7AD02_BRACR|nr:hypothetical protein DY000_02055318 [Brassica cretica]